MKLSAHFELDELLAPGDPVKPSEEVIERLRDLCEHALEPLRDRLGRPLGINSGYRSVAYNRKIGGAPGSQHCSGIAADIAIGDDEACIKAAAIASQLPHVGGIGLYPGRGFIHVDIRPRIAGRPTWWAEIGKTYQAVPLKLKQAVRANGGVI